MVIFLIIIYILMIFFTYGIVYQNRLRTKYIVKSILWPMVFIVRGIKTLLFLIHELVSCCLTLFGFNYTNTDRYKNLQKFFVD